MSRAHRMCLATATVLALLLMRVSVRAESTTSTPSGVTADRVMGWFKVMPPECRTNHPPCTGPDGGYERGPDARTIAQAISNTAPSEVRARQLAVFSAYESGNKAHADGDCGTDPDTGVYGCKSHGCLQLSTIPADDAYHPATAMREWLRLADADERICKGNDPDTRLSPLASGNCEHGREKVRYRVQIASELP